ncbi:MAG TPA: hypothetical protein DDW52_13345 [Planctomycetaceae bacterium]|nr:hypothetical protein [Planctomycetaceae bacterium]
MKRFSFAFSLPFVGSLLADRADSARTAAKPRRDVGEVHCERHALLSDSLGKIEPEVGSDEVWIADVGSVDYASDEELRAAIACHLRLSGEGKRLALKNVEADLATTLFETRINRMIEIRNVLPRREVG